LTALAALTALVLDLFGPGTVVHVVGEVVALVHVDVDITVTPVAAARDRSADGHAHTERQCRGAPRVPGRGWIRGPRGRWPGPVHHGRVVARYVDHLRIRRLDLDDGLLLRGRLARLRRRRVLDDHLLLLVRLQIALPLRLRTETLDGVHRVLPLTE